MPRQAKHQSDEDDDDERSSNSDAHTPTPPPQRRSKPLNASSSTSKPAAATATATVKSNKLSVASALDPKRRSTSRSPSTSKQRKKSRSKHDSDDDNDDAPSDDNDNASDDDDAQNIKSKSNRRIASASNKSNKQVTTNSPKLVDADEDDSRSPDQWRVLSNTLPQESIHAQSQQLAQSEKHWTKFTLKYPLPSSQHATAGATLALRRELLTNHRSLIRLGIPPAMRRNVWELLTGSRTFPERLEYDDRFVSLRDAFREKLKSAAKLEQQAKDAAVARASVVNGTSSSLPHYVNTRANNYTQLAQEAQHRLATQDLLQQHKYMQHDVKHALGDHPKYRTDAGSGELLSVLQAYCARCGDSSQQYCSALSHVGGLLLLLLPPERCFWLLCALTDIVLPRDYYTTSLLGARADAYLLKLLVFQRLPKLHAHFEKFQFQLADEICSLWFMQLFVSVLTQHVLLRVWDCLMLDGANQLLCCGLALMRLNEKLLMQLQSVDALRTHLHQKCGAVAHDADALLRLMNSSSCAITKDDERRREVERKYMESNYMQALQTVQRKKLKDAELARQRHEERLALVDEQRATLQRKPTSVMKLGARGAPRQTQITLKTVSRGKDEADFYVHWVSKSKSTPDEARMIVRECTLGFGFGEGQFAKRSQLVSEKFIVRKQAQLAFSLCNVTRSLDIVCENELQFKQWAVVLCQLPFRELHSVPNGISQALKAAQQSNVESQSPGGKDDSPNKQQQTKNRLSMPVSAAPVTKSPASRKPKSRHESDDDDEAQSEDDSASEPDSPSADASPPRKSAKSNVTAAAARLSAAKHKQKGKSKSNSDDDDDASDDDR